MRLQKYIIDESRMERRMLEEFRDFFPKFYKDCKKFLDDWEKSGAKTFLNRNTHEATDFYLIKKSHVDSHRNPMDTPRELHDYLNEIFKRKFGWNVRNGVFTSGKYLDSQYGSNQYIFFPIGNYKFVYSPKIEDLYSYFEDYDLVVPPVNYYEARDAWEHEYGEDYDGTWYYKNKDTGLNDIDAALADLKADGIEAERYDLEWIPAVEWEDFLEDLRNNAKESHEDAVEAAIKDANYTDKNLKNAINSENEVIFNCKRYYLIRNRYEDLIKKFLNIRKHYKNPKQLTLFDIEELL
jgi:hypothetical protein